MEKADVAFLNAAAEAYDKMDLRKKHGVCTTFHKCPGCGKAKLVAETVVVGGTVETEVECPACKKKVTVRA